MLIPFDELWARHGIKSEGAVHLGANNGAEAHTYRKLGIKRVIWVEALPTVHAALVKTLKMFPGNTALRACLSDKDGSNVMFHVASNQGQSSSILEFGTHSVEHPSVKFIKGIPMRTIRFDTLLKKHHITLGDHWFLNCDLQGAELMALKGMGDLLKHFDYAYVEVNERELYKNCPMVGEIDTYLSGFGFVGVECKMVPQFWGDKFYKRK